MERERIKDDKIEEMQKEILPKEQAKKEGKIFRNVVILMIGFVLMFSVIYGAKYFANSFEIGGVKFEVDKTAITEKTLYRTSLPVSDKVEMTGKVIAADYNFWLRTDPRELEKIEFNGDVNLKKNMVLNLTQDFNCEGDGIIGIANLLNLYKIIGTDVIKDENASCDRAGTYAYLTITEGNETSIEQVGPACYTIYVKDCEILKATEKFMLETFIETNKKIEEDK